ncbi:hypothetical protein [Tsukamurella sp. PLM1]|uniref:hypothetical protein n=1 Tax=Tsukamurella sp. PLM1 TaxID=2929795 RepID=UPI00205BE72D|nr:hypothetical protein MTP03_07780 [Tsukamurella sp. PLM1]
MSAVSPDLSAPSAVVACRHFASPASVISRLRIAATRVTVILRGIRRRSSSAARRWAGVGVSSSGGRWWLLVSNRGRGRPGFDGAPFPPRPLLAGPLLAGPLPVVGPGRRGGTVWARGTDPGRRRGSSGGYCCCPG